MKAIIKSLYSRLWYVVMAAPLLALANAGTAAAESGSLYTQLPNSIPTSSNGGIPNGVTSHLIGAFGQVMNIAAAAGAAGMAFGAAKWAYGHATHNPQHGQTGRQAIVAGLVCTGIALGASHFASFASHIAGWVG
jgi:hypothetical protein